MKLTQAIRSKADSIIMVKESSDVSKYTNGMATIIATAMLKEQGWYGCKIGTVKTLFVIS